MPSLTPPIPGSPNDPNRPFGTVRRLYDSPVGFGFELSDEDMITILGVFRGTPRPNLRRSGSRRESQLFRQQEIEFERQVALQNALSLQQREDQNIQAQQNAQTPRQRSAFYQVIRDRQLAEEGTLADRSREGMIFDPNYNYENIVGQGQLTPGQLFGPQPGWLPYFPPIPPE